MTASVQAVPDLYNRAWDAVVTHAVVIVLPSMVYVAISTALALGVAGARRKEVLDNIGVVISFSLLGVVLGFFTGNSRSPAVQAVLPALLTFVAGMAAYLATKDTRAVWRDVVPFGIAALLVAVLLSVSHGLGLKRLSVEEEREFDQRRLDYERVQLEVRKLYMLRELGLAASAPENAASARGR